MVMAEFMQKDVQQLIGPRLSLGELAHHAIVNRMALHTEAVKDRLMVIVVAHAIVDPQVSFPGTNMDYAGFMPTVETMYPPEPERWHLARARVPPNPAADG